MLASPSLSNHSWFFGIFCQQGLPYGVVYLVSTRMVQVFPLKINLRSANGFESVHSCQFFLKAFLDAIALQLQGWGDQIVVHSPLFGQ